MERHTVFDAQGDDTLTVSLGATREASACRAYSVESYANSDEKSCSQKRKHEKRKKKNRQRRLSLSTSLSVKRGGRTARSPSRDDVSKARTSHDKSDQAEAYRAETHSLSPDRPPGASPFPWMLTPESVQQPGTGL